MRTERMWHKVLKAFPDDAPADKIAETAKTLEGMTYEPALLLKMPRFLRMGRKASRGRDRTRTSGGPVGTLIALALGLQLLRHFIRENEGRGSSGQGFVL